MMGRFLAELPPVGVSPARVRDLVQEILSRPEFEALTPNLVQRLLEAAVEGVGRVLQRVYAAASELPPVGAIAIALVAGTVFVVAARFLRGVSRERRLGAGVTGSERPPREWEAEAVRHEQARRWRDALRCRYRALIAELAQRGLIAEVPGRTSREYLNAAVAALPAAQSDLAAITDAFEAAWYGHRRVNADDVAALQQASARVAAAAQGRPLEAVMS